MFLKNTFPQISSTTIGIFPFPARMPFVLLFLIRILFPRCLRARADITKRKDVKELWITDRLGNVRFKQKYNAGQKNVSINISSLPPGIYAVVASHGKSQVSEKFIKE